jgi:hypothetical protein
VHTFKRIDDAYVIERIIDKTLKLVWTLGLIK